MEGQDGGWDGARRRKGVREDGEILEASRGKYVDYREL